MDVTVLNCGMDFINDIDKWWASRDWVKTYFIVCGIPILLYIFSLIKDAITTDAETKKQIKEYKQKEKEEKKRNKKPMNTIQKVCILLCIVFFFATSGFGATQTGIAGITTGLMVASFIGFFLFKDK